MNSVDREEFPLTITKELIGELYVGDKRALSFSYLQRMRNYSFIPKFVKNDEDLWREGMVEAMERAVGIEVESLHDLIYNAVARPMTNVLGRATRRGQFIGSEPLSFIGEDQILEVSDVVQAKAAELAHEYTVHPLKVHERSASILSKYLRSQFRYGYNTIEPKLDFDRMSIVLIDNAQVQHSRGDLLAGFSANEHAFMKRLSKRAPKSFRAAIKAALLDSESEIQEVFYDLC